MMTGKSQKTRERMQQVVDAENRKLCFEGCINPPPPPAFVSGYLNLNYAAYVTTSENKFQTWFIALDRLCH